MTMDESKIGKMKKRYTGEEYCIPLVWTLYARESKQ